ncbi:MAG: hypothetical protein ACOX0A_08295 [Thermoguttaceae bacterium]|jgi:hypothetical protein
MPTKSLPVFYQTLDARLAQLAAEVDVPEDRAGIVVNSLQLVSILNVKDDVVVREKLRDFDEAIESVEDQDKRDYLCRILIDAAQKAFVNPASAQELDELLDKIEDKEERQNALFLRGQVLALDLARNSEDRERKRDELMARIDELDDLLQYERVVATIRATDRIVGYEPSSEEEPLETSEGLLREYDGALVEILNSKPEEEREELLRTSLFAESLEKAFEVLESLESGELDAEEIESLRDTAPNLVLRSHLILSQGARLRAFIERYGAFDALIEELALAVEAAAGRDPLRFPAPVDEYVAEIDYLLDLGAKLAQEEPPRLVDIAATILRARPSEEIVDRARLVARNSISIMAEFDDERCARTYRNLVRAYLDAGRSKSATKLARLLMQRLDEISSRPTREHWKRTSFPELFEALDSEMIESFVELEETEDFQRDLREFLALAVAIWKNFSDLDALDGELKNIAENTFKEMQYDDALLAANATIALAARVRLLCKNRANLN